MIPYWTLSYLFAKKHFEEMTLYCDNYYQNLAEKIGLKYDNIINIENHLSTIIDLPFHWEAPKIIAGVLNENKNSILVDYDYVFFQDPRIIFKKKFQNKDVIVEKAENNWAVNTLYKRYRKNALKYHKELNIKEINNSCTKDAVTTSVLYFKNNDALKDYCSKVLKIINFSDQTPDWVKDKWETACGEEQWFLQQYCNHHKLSIGYIGEASYDSKYHPAYFINAYKLNLSEKTDKNFLLLEEKEKNDVYNPIPDISIKNEKVFSKEELEEMFKLKSIRDEKMLLVDLNLRQKISFLKEIDKKIKLNTLLSEKESNFLNLYPLYDSIFFATKNNRLLPKGFYFAELIELMKKEKIDDTVYTEPIVVYYLTLRLNCSIHFHGRKKNPHISRLCRGLIYSKNKKLYNNLKKAIASYSD
jgi:hypothetical protein